MTVKEILAKIKATLGADAPAEVTTLLADADRQLIDMAEALSAANRESADRKRQIKELTEKVTGLEADLASKDAPEAKAELERLRKVEAEHAAMLEAETAKLNAAWEAKAATLNVDANHKLHEKVSKVKSRFIMPKEGETLTAEQVRKNLDTYELLETANYFTVETQSTGGNPPANPGNPAPAYSSSGQAVVAKIKSVTNQ